MILHGNDWQPSLLIFDYDGTIHETMALYQSAVCDVIKSQRGSLLPKRSPLPESGQFAAWIGMNAEAMWDDYLPGLDSDSRHRLIRMVGEEMNRLIETKSRWYDGVRKMLDILKEAGYDMLILSNCTELYAKAHWDHFHMGKWFDAFLACESFQNRPKEKIVSGLLVSPEETLQLAVCKDAQKMPRLAEKIRRDSGLHAPVVIGDKASDKKAAAANQLPFVGCLYGYGTEEELAGAVLSARLPEEIAAFLTES